MPLRSLRRNPFRTILQRMPRVSTASPEAISPKASFETPSEHATRPEGQAESPLRNMPYVPKATPRDPSVLPSESATCSRIPQAGRTLPDDAQARHLSPSACTVNHLREPSEQATCPETHPGRIRILPECATCLRVPKHIGTSWKPPSAPRAQRVRTSGSLRVCHMPRTRFSPG